MSGTARMPHPGLTLYSPAPATNPMHGLNLRFAGALGYALGTSVAVEAVALPESVNRLAALGRDARAAHWPIVTSADLMPARLGSGPPWHRYDRPSPDLRFLARLYDVGFGIAVPAMRDGGPEQLHGGRIGVPARPSAVRWMAELLLAAWGLEDVELVSMPPAQALPALREGSIHATAWNLVIPGGTGLLAPGESFDLRFLPIDAATLARIDAAAPFTPAHSRIGKGLLSFTQALTAWDESDADTIVTALDLLAAGLPIPGFPGDIAAMTDWPALDPAMLHPVAVEFYRKRGLTL